MKKAGKENYLLHLGVFIGFVFFLVLVGGADAVWSPPLVNPPADNIPAPVNIGLISQGKVGGLGVRGVFIESTDAILADPAVNAARVITVGVTENPPLGVDVLMRTSTAGHTLALRGSGTAPLTFFTINPTNVPSSPLQSNIGVTSGESFVILGYNINDPARLSIQKTGEVAIGLNTPLTKFHVTGGQPFVLLENINLIDDGAIAHNRIPGWQFRGSDSTKWETASLPTTFTPNRFDLYANDAMVVRALRISVPVALNTCSQTTISGFIPIEPLKIYKASIFVEPGHDRTLHSAGVIFYDQDKNPITYECFPGNYQCGYFLNNKQISASSQNWQKFEGYLFSSAFGSKNAYQCVSDEKPGTDTCMPPNARYVKFQIKACNDSTSESKGVSRFAFPALEEADFGENMFRPGTWSDRIHSDNYCDRNGQNCIPASSFVGGYCQSVYYASLPLPTCTYGTAKSVTDSSGTIYRVTAPPASGYLKCCTY